MTELLQQLMLEYNFSITYNPGKNNTVSDFLSRNVISSVDILYDGLYDAQQADQEIQDKIKNISRFPQLRLLNGLLFLQKRQRHSLYLCALYLSSPNLAGGRISRPKKERDRISLSLSSVV